MDLRRMKTDKCARFCALIIVLSFSLMVNAQSHTIDATNSPYYILNDTTIDVGDTMLVGPGAEIFIGDHVNIQVKGYLKIKGEPENKAVIKPVTPGIGWGEFKIYIPVDSLIVENAIVEDGRFLSFESVNQYKNVTFINNQNLVWNAAISRFIFGKLKIEDCKVYGSNKGEGFLVHSIDTPIVINSYFERIPDAIEYLNCMGGRIGNCQFFDMIDDAIDLNHCTGTLVDSNLIVNVGDRGMEIGSENNGSSSDIHVYRNVLANCHVGINFKEGSTGLIENNTLFGNNKAITSLASGRPDIGSSIRIINCIFDGNGIPIFTEEASDYTVSYSACSSRILEGVGNIFAYPYFVDTATLDFNLTPNSGCIDQGARNGKHDPDGTFIDMGAFYYHQDLTPKNTPKADGVKVVVNPVREELILELNDAYYKIEIYNTNGQLKYEQSSVQINVLNRIRMNVDDLDRGLYILVVSNGEKTVKKKFMKL